MVSAEFKKVIETELRRVVGEGKQIDFREVEKNNGLVLTGLTVRDMSESIAPTVYLENYEKRYLKSEAIEDIAADIIKLIEQNKADGKFNLIVENFADFENIKERIYFQLVNAEKNKRKLESIPHVNEFGDLAVMFRVHISMDDAGKASFVITNDHMNAWGVTVDELYAIAKENTPKLFPAKVQTMFETLVEMMGPSAKDVLGASAQNQPDMYVISNEEKIHGAGSVLYSGVLKSIADKTESDLYIIPSSIHECLAVPANMLDSADSVDEMIKEVNGTQVAPEEVLGEHAYLYSRKDDKVIA